MRVLDPAIRRQQPVRRVASRVLARLIPQRPELVLLDAVRHRLHLGRPILDDRLVEEIARRRVVVEAHPVPELAAQQLVRRHVQDLAGQIPQADVEGRAISTECGEAARGRLDAAGASPAAVLRARPAVALRPAVQPGRQVQACVAAVG